MGVHHVDVLSSHRPDPGTPVEETMGALHSAVRSGKPRHVGISTYSREQGRRRGDGPDGAGHRC